MAFIKTISTAQATGEVHAMYQRQQDKHGYVPNYAKVFCHRPHLMGLWAQLLAGIRQSIEPKDFELATLAAAHALKNSACSLAHGQKLTGFYSSQEIIAIVENLEVSVLSEAEKCLVDFARKVALDASGITEEDIASLRRQGFSDGEIFDIAAVAAARCFFAKLLDALGVEAELPANSMEDRLKTSLAVGRPISEKPVERLP